MPTSRLASFTGTRSEVGLGLTTRHGSVRGPAALRHAGGQTNDHQDVETLTVRPARPHLRQPSGGRKPRSPASARDAAKHPPGSLRAQRVDRPHHQQVPEPSEQRCRRGAEYGIYRDGELRLREPEIRERDNSTLVVIRHESLASPETIIIQYLETNDTINNSKARDLTSIASEVQMRRVIQRMERAGEIERVPGTQKGDSLYRRPR
jgi:hypothetical protein